MRTKSTLLGIALASVLAVGGVAAADFGDGGGLHGHHGGGEMMILHKLDLSDTQRANIKQIVSSSREQFKSSHQALRQQRDAFEAMSPTSAGYQAAASSLAKAEAQATQDRVMRMADLRAKIYTVLTPAQQSQIATLKAQQQTRRQQWQQFQQQHPQQSGE
ncbi:MAG TPA: Spy/CpxP family protein refolding chaperone [Xanthomonadaceae bacterium]|jgi:protein CpxP|nr:Spy/CpxP family protein refolding chaperone [Xanthomonadaceae bacterium]